MAAEIECDAKLIHEIKNAANNLAANGGAFLYEPSSKPDLAPVSVSLNLDRGHLLSALQTPRLGQTWLSSTMPLRPEKPGTKERLTNNNGKASSVHELEY